ncbi:hypothetical protein K450DRAFT_257615 [Umbelopsis ramanniana AG]|uniref:Protein kinase domain-containing protein n=1 Tax=Umbelopsis ramanniana AG TaxID=1314678 RepID=A0AAD5HBL3_UMBRA|nr:uncharacterized protein K450DRAFT_257615 [Umbelopsis ramanniana AG]KAI8576303.1 hypothetical protein K450DRAFT_257615 [Umbelopsis ramanniana AG]
MPTEVATATAWNFQIPVTASAEAMDEPCPELSSSVSTRDSAIDTRSIHSTYTPPRKMTSKLQGLFHHSNNEQSSGKRHSMNLFGKSRSSSQSSGSTSPSAIPSLSQKYGSCKKGFVSEGATAVIRLVTKSNCCSDVYCVKAFHKKAKDDSDRSYMKRMTSEFCISSTLRHENVVKTLDLVIDEKGRYCAVMEYCSGGDLFEVVRERSLTDEELACLFKQLLRGLQYMHESGVVHRDIKPENLVLTSSGTLKIADFGVSDVFQSCFETTPRNCKGAVGSHPYHSPELFENGNDYDGRAMDVWSAAITFYCMKFRRLPFLSATKDDASYAEFLAALPNRDWAPFANMSQAQQDCLYGMLDINPKTRWTIKQALESEWMQSVEVCQDGALKSGWKHYHYLPSRR